MTDSYYILRVEDPADGDRARLVYTRDYPLRSWMTGLRFDKEPPVPIIIRLRGTDEENWVLGDLWITPITVMSKRLYEALVQSGVDNLDCYSVELHDTEKGDVFKDFLAFNLVGKIAAVDLAKSTFAPDNKNQMIAADIDALAIDSRKAHGALMFRLAESVNAIVVHEHVKQVIEASGIDALTFLSPEDWAG